MTSAAGPDLWVKMKKIIFLPVLMIGAAACFFLWTACGDLRRTAENKSRTSNKGNLSLVRSALQVYYGDNEGRFPTDDLSCLAADKKYPGELPPLWVEYDKKHPHPRTSGVVVYSSGSGSDTGQYAYMNDPAYPANWGSVFVDCTHLDGRGISWSTF